MSKYGHCPEHANDTGEECPTCEINRLRTRVAELESECEGWKVKDQIQAVVALWGLVNELGGALEGIIAITDRNHVAWDHAHAVLTKLKALNG